MKVTNLCMKMRKEQKIALYNWAKRLDATEMLVHTNGSVDLWEDGNCICEDYFPTGEELKPKRKYWYYAEGIGGEYLVYKWV